ncbi:MAG: copper chaperone PCu(A)C [Rhodospirillaceae bacterium]|nr:copper chaperone PCu(A)C [Rhodospirillaceae bacterium]
MRGLIFASFLLVAGTAHAEVAVTDAWVRETIGAGRTSAGYARIVNTGPADRLLGVGISTGTAEVHESREQNGMMRMLPVKALEIPAMGEAVLKPGGYHIMIMNTGLKRGESVELTFTFEKAGRITVPAKIAPITATAAP